MLWYGEAYDSMRWLKMLWLMGRLAQAFIGFP